MAVTRSTLTLARRLRRAVGTEADNAVRALTAEWVKTWDGQLASAWAQASVDLAAEAQRLSHWPRPTDIARTSSAMAALQATEDTLTRLATSTISTAVNAAARAVDADLDLEARVIASQAPATERETLLAHVGGRPAGGLLVREQDQGTVRLTVLSRIRTFAPDIIRQRVQGQIVSTANPLPAETMAVVRRELIRGVETGDNPRTTAARMVAQVEGAFNGGLTRALTIARTEVLDAYRSSSHQIHAANADLVPAWQWLATLDTRVCPSCLAMHGQQFPTSQPGPWDHQQGRCARLPVLAPWSQLGISAPEPPSAVPDAQAWFAGLSRVEQLRIMGPARLGLLETGQVGWGDLATLRTTTGWRPSYVPTPVRDLRRRAAQGLPPTPHPARARPDTARWVPPAPLTPGRARRAQTRMGGYTLAGAAALTQYTAGGARDMNALLRGTRPPTERDSLVLGDIRDAVAEMRPLPVDVLLYRYVGPEAFGVASVADLTGLVGRRLQERGFMSTTLVAEGWSDRAGQMAMASRRPVRMEIAAPAGTRAAYVDPISAHPGQYEMVLAPGTVFQVVEVVVEGRWTVVRVRVVP